jgi:RNA polymerase sigma-70 factor (ECF subfamily)
MGLFSKKNDDFAMVRIAANQAELRALIHSLLPGDPSVDDVLQRANLVIWKKRSAFKPGTDFRAWAFSIARWEVRAYLKERKRRSWLVIDDDLACLLYEAAEQTAEELPMADMRAALEKCMGQLKPEERDLVTHRYYTDAPLQVFAEQHGRPVTSLKTSLARIRASLKRCIESLLSIERVTGRETT